MVEQQTLFLTSMHHVFSRRPSTLPEYPPFSNLNQLISTPSETNGEGGPDSGGLYHATPNPRPQKRPISSPSLANLPSTVTASDSTKSPDAFNDLVTNQDSAMKSMEMFQGFSLQRLPRLKKLLRNHQLVQLWGRGSW